VEFGASQVDDAKKSGFRSDWGPEEIDQHLRSLFVRVFAWQDSNRDAQITGDGATDDWVLLAREPYKSKLTPYPKPPAEITGHDLVRVKGGSGRNWSQGSLYFGKSSILNLTVTGALSYPVHSSDI
jgi:hypothetical protein